MAPLNQINQNVSNERLSTPIQQFYSGANVFITGGTGFLGRLLVEKLLRSCPDIGNIYLLIRNKKGKNLHERIEGLLEDVIFDGLKEVDPKFRHKISAIEGDVALPELGINEQDKKLLTSEVSIVFHVAATVNFNEKLKLAVLTNICGTQRVIKLCNEMVNLKALVHVSTAYSNCVQEVVEEKFYPAPISSAKLIGLVEELNEDVQDKITDSLLGDFPNTYAYTKALAETLILEDNNGLPSGIFRPAVVTSTYKEPVKGWINNLYGATGVVAGGYLGIIRVLQCDKNSYANIVPADMTVNALIAMPWDIQRRHLKEKDKVPPIYNFEMNSQQPITWFQYMKGIYKYGRHYPTVHAMWYYFFLFIKNRFTYLILVSLLHFLPAVLGDAVLICMAKKPRLVKLYKKVGKFASVISYFSTQNFQFKSTRIREMISEMSPEDQRVFFCDLKKLDWEEYFKTYIPGLRVYLLKDPMSTFKQASLKLRRLYWCHQAVKVIIALVFFRLLWFILSVLF